MRTVNGPRVIAFLNSWPDLAEWRRSPWVTRFVDGARLRATVLGFGFEECWLAEPGMTPAWMSQILRARGVRGVLIGSLPEADQKLDFYWPHFAAVAQSHTLPHPELSHSVSDYAHAMQLAIGELGRLGYQRIGYASAPLVEARTQRLNLSAYLGCQAVLPRRDRIAPLDWSSQSSQDLKRWIDRTKPDAIVSHDIAMRDAVRHLKLRVPQDLGVATLACTPASPLPRAASAGSISSWSAAARWRSICSSPNFTTTNSGPSSPDHRFDPRPLGARQFFTLRGGGIRANSRDRERHGCRAAERGRDGLKRQPHDHHAIRDGEQQRVGIGEGLHRFIAAVRLENAGALSKHLVAEWLALLAGDITIGFLVIHEVLQLRVPLEAAPQANRQHAKVTDAHRAMADLRVANGRFA